MKLKQLKLKQSVTSLTDSEMKNVIGGTQRDESSCHGVCYVGIYQGNYDWREVGNDYKCVCNYFVP